jgi:hypothetical protein
LVILTLKNIINRNASIALLSVLMIAEIIAVNSRYPINWVPAFEATYPFEATPPDLAILSSETAGLNGYEDLKKSYIEIEEEKLGHKLTRLHSRAKLAASFAALNALTHYRVLDLQNPFNDARTSYFHKSIGGYHGAKLQRYQDFIDRVLRAKATSNQALAMLNTKYVINGAEHERFIGALGPAWVADNILWVDDAEAEISQIRNVDLASTAIMHTDFLSETASFSIPDSDVSSDNISDVSLIHYHPDGSTYEVSTEHDGMFVFSEVWYPDGWKATVDGIEVPLVRANYILRALPITAGRHTVELRFEPSGRKLAGLASGVGSAVLLLFLLSMSYMAYMERRKRIV